jgi:predicted membrane metal-binding protein
MSSTICTLWLRTERALVFGSFLLLVLLLVGVQQPIFNLLVLVLVLVLDSFVVLSLFLSLSLSLSFSLLKSSISKKKKKKRGGEKVLGRQRVIR